MPSHQTNDADLRSTTSRIDAPDVSHGGAVNVGLAGPAVETRTNRRPLLAAGTLIGVGMGGFVDGIVLHQILQVHNMVASKYPTFGVDPQTALVNTEINMFWDGLFHAFTWLTTAAGIGLLWHAVRRRDVPLSSPALLGSMLAGWGLFNLVEGVIDHHVLHIHQVVERLGTSVWDYAFLGVSAVMLLAGIAIARSGRRKPADLRSA